MQVFYILLSTYFFFFFIRFAIPYHTRVSMTTIAIFSVGHTLGTLGIHGLPGVVGVGVEVDIISFIV